MQSDLCSVCAATWTLLSTALFWCYYAGLAAGYVTYDVMHYALHHGVPCSKRSHCGRMRAYHARHHFPGQETAAFGVTSRFWDRVFGTQWKTNVGQTPVRQSTSRCSQPNTLWPPTPHTKWH